MPRERAAHPPEPGGRRRARLRQGPESLPAPGRARPRRRRGVVNFTFFIATIIFLFFIFLIINIQYSFFICFRIIIFFHVFTFHVFTFLFYLLFLLLK